MKFLIFLSLQLVLSSKVFSQEALLADIGFSHTKQYIYTEFETLDGEYYLKYSTCGVDYPSSCKRINECLYSETSLNDEVLVIEDDEIRETFRKMLVTGLRIERNHEQFLNEFQELLLRVNNLCSSFNFGIPNA